MVSPSARNKRDNDPTLSRLSGRSFNQYKKTLTAGKKAKASTVKRRDDPMEPKLFSQKLDPVIIKKSQLFGGMKYLYILETRFILLLNSNKESN